MDFCYHSATWTSVFLQFSLSFTNKRRGTALMEPGKRGAAGGGGGVGGKREAGREDYKDGSRF